MRSVVRRAGNVGLLRARELGALWIPQARRGQPRSVVHRLQTGRTADGRKRLACASNAVWPIGAGAVEHGRAEREAMGERGWEARPEKRLHAMDNL